MDFTLWIGPLPIRWVAIIENCSSNGFTDRQLRGPFTHWSHNHRFVPVDENYTEVIDEITFSIKKHPLWGIAGLGMSTSLPLLFAFRAWKTHRLLERPRRETTQKTPQTVK
jgi:ligand-binding SRPBCC domain-containing protein